MYNPYSAGSQSDTPSSNINQSSKPEVPRWGPTPAATSSSEAQQSTTVAGSTFNITNNNNINYNYGSNITAISSDSGSVPTFHDIDKKKKQD